MKERMCVCVGLFNPPRSQISSRPLPWECEKLCQCLRHFALISTGRSECDGSLNEEIVVGVILITENATNLHD